MFDISIFKRPLSDEAWENFKKLIKQGHKSPAWPKGLSKFQVIELAKRNAESSDLEDNIHKLCVEYGAANKFRPAIHLALSAWKSERHLILIGLHITSQELEMIFIYLLLNNHRTIKGNLDLRKNCISSLDKLHFPEEIEGILFLDSNKIKSFAGAILPKKVKGGISVTYNDLAGFEGFVPPQHVGNHMDFGHNKIKTLEGFVFPAEFHGGISFQKNRLTNLKGVCFPTTLEGPLNISYNKISTLKDAVFPVDIEGYFTCIYNKISTLSDTTLPRNVEGFVAISHNGLTDLDDVVFPKFVGSHLCLNSNKIGFLPSSIVWPEWCGANIDLSANNICSLGLSRPKYYLGGNIVVERTNVRSQNDCMKDSFLHGGRVVGAKTVRGVRTKEKQAQGDAQPDILFKSFLGYNILQLSQPVIMKALELCPKACRLAQITHEKVLTTFLCAQRIRQGDLKAPNERTPLPPIPSELTLLIFAILFKVTLADHSIAKLTTPMRILMGDKEGMEAFKTTFKQCAETLRENTEEEEKSPDT